MNCNTQKQSFADVLQGTRKIATWKIAPDPNTNTNPNPGGNFFRGNPPGAIFRSPFFKIGVLKNFANFTNKVPV